LRIGARALLGQAVEAEIAALLSGHADKHEIAPVHCPVSPELPTERIAHLLKAADCCTAGFQTGLCRVRAHSVIRRCRLNVRFPERRHGWAFISTRREL
jgi:hypothetical protein